MHHAGDRSAGAGAAGGAGDLGGGGAEAGDGRGVLVLTAAACSLADVLAERGPLPDGEVRAVAAAAASALARVHDVGLVHADVKPANLLLTDDGELWLADFDAAAPADGRPLRRGSPPRLRPGAAARPEADIAALAIALIELATGAVADPGVDWRAGDLRRMGCSPALSAEISFLLGAGSASSARAVAARFERGVLSSLPRPAARARGADSTPTVEFMPVRPPPRPAAPASRPAARTRFPRERARESQSARSQAKRSSWVSRRTTGRAAPPETKTTAGRRTLL